MRKRTTIAIGCALVLGLQPGCAGDRGDGAEPDDGDGSGTGQDTGEPGADDEPAPLGCDGEAFDPGPAPLRRLTHAEYVAAVRDLVGVDASAQAASFPADVTTGSFDNDAANQTISVLLGEGYLSAAQGIAAQVLGDATLRDALVSCDVEGDDGCLRDLVGRFGRRAWRRPLTDAEVEAFLDLAATEADADDKVAIVIEAALQSPSFLFRAERGEPAHDTPGILRLTGWEVATRLSFFLWGTTPDDALLDAAEAGELDDADGIAEHAARLLEDERARETLQRFGEQWFRVTDIAQQYRDPAEFPEWNPELAASMRAELRLLLRDFMWSGEDFLGLYTATYGYADDRLAAIYEIGEIDADGGGAPVAVDWAGSDERGGLFTTAAFATASSRAGDTSPVTRAMWVREVTLCDPPPPPPPDVPILEPEDGESVEDAFDRHTEDPACAGCHIMLDPIGHGLERYDSIGRLRTADESGDPVREEGQIYIDGEMYEFAGGKDLGAKVAASGAAERCVVAHAYRWANGRHETEADACTLDRLGQTFTDRGRTFESVILGIVTSDAFRYRRSHS